jgi:zinc transport system substrate-binding protein
VINLLDVLGSSAREEELVEGMQAEEEAEEEGEAEYDEHVWLSLRNAKQFTAEIARVIGELDPDHAAEYKGNADTYTASLDDLDSRYQEAVSGGRVSTLLFGDRFPFRYLTEDYGLDYYAAFAGCSAETEASFETIVYLAGKVNELGLKSICTIENSDQKIAQTIRDNTETKDQEIYAFDSLQSIKAEDIENGVTYLSLMENNLDVLKKALG